MKFLIAILAAATLLAGSVLAQTPASKTPAPQHQPGAPAQPPSSAVQAPSQSPASEKVDPAKEAAIRHLMDITESSKLGDNISGAITTQVRSVMGRAIQPDQLPKFMDTFSQKFSSSAPTSAVTDAEVPIYSHYFSMDDIQALIKFYESPLGQRVVKTLPQLAQETQNVGVQMDQKVALDVLRGMSDEYPALKQMLPPDQSGAGPGAAPAPGSSPAPGAAPAPPQ